MRRETSQFWIFLLGRYLRLLLLRSEMQWQKKRKRTKLNRQARLSLRRLSYYLVLTYFDSAPEIFAQSVYVQYTHLQYTHLQTLINQPSISECLLPFSFNRVTYKISITSTFIYKKVYLHIFLCKNIHLHQLLCPCNYKY